MARSSGNPILARLGAFTSTENLKAILGDLSTTKNLGGILGDLSTTDNLLERLEGILNQIRALGFVGDIYFADSARPDDTGDGKTPETAKKTIDAAVDLCSSNHGDVVVALATSTLLTPKKSFDENANAGGVILDIHQVALIFINYPEVSNSNLAPTAVITIAGDHCLVFEPFISAPKTGTAVGINISGDLNRIIRPQVFGGAGHGIYINGGVLNRVEEPYCYGQDQPTRAGIALDGAASENQIIRPIAIYCTYGFRVIHANCAGNCFIDPIALVSGTAFRIEAGSYTLLSNPQWGECTTGIVDAGTDTIIIPGFMGIGVNNADNQVSTSLVTADRDGSVLERQEFIHSQLDEKPEWGTPTNTSYTTASGNEETILTTAVTDPALFYFDLSLRNMVAGDNFTVRVKKSVNGTDFDLKSEQNFVDAPTVKVFEIEEVYIDSSIQLRVTIQRNSANNRAFPYNWNILKEV